VLLNGSLFQRYFADKFPFHIFLLAVLLCCHLIVKGLPINLIFFAKARKFKGHNKTVGEKTLKTQMVHGVHNTISAF